MKPYSITDPVKVPCKYCGKEILPDTAKRTGGYCMPCSEDPKLTYGIYYVSPIQNPETSETFRENTQAENKVPCRFCGSMILPDTSRRTGGFCMPHSGYNMEFLETLGGEPEFSEPTTQKAVLEQLLSKETKIACGVLFSVMQIRDELRLFSVKPQGEAQLIAGQGVALFREGKCITGFVANWVNNPGFDQDQEEDCDKDELAAAFGEDWCKIEKKIPEGSTFVRFRTSQRSWMSLCGRAGYAIKHKGKYLWHVITALN